MERFYLYVGKDKYNYFFRSIVIISILLLNILTITSFLDDQENCEEKFSQLLQLMQQNSSLGTVKLLEE